MSEIAKIKQARARVKGQVTRIANSINEETAASQARVKLKKLEELWEAFEAEQSNIENNELQDAEQAEAFHKECESERQVFEIKYFEAAAKAQETIDRDAARQEAQHFNIRHNPLQGREAVPYRRNKSKLPEIKLPEFNGEYSKWLFFKNSFETTIHQDDELSHMQKHQYLVGVLKGEAHKVIEGFTISDENYENAWKLLKNTYDNKIMIIETYMDELMNIPAISKDNKADSLRQMIWHIQTHIASLKALSQPVEYWDTIVIHIAKKKLDYTEQRDWQNHVKDRTSDNMPTLEEFIKFLTERSHTLRMLSQSKPKTLNVKQMPQSQQKKKKNEEKIVLASTSASVSTITCKLCKGDHPIFKCEELIKRTPEERRKLLIEKRHCVNCLNTGHIARDCRASSCRKCGNKHNTLIHKDDTSKPLEENSESKAVNHSIVSASVSTSSQDSTSIHVSRKQMSQVILSTAQLNIQDADGKQFRCRALLDPGSQSNLITSDLARKLRLSYINRNTTITGVDKVKSETQNAVHVLIKAIHSDFMANIECFVLPSITEQLPQSKINAEEIIVPKDVQLADSTFNKPGKIDILIGAALYWKIVIGIPRNHIDGQPALQNTQLGWIIGGEVSEKSSHEELTCLTVTNAQLQQQLEKFWKQETLSEDLYTEEEKLCKRHFSETTLRDANGRFIVRLPTRPEIILGESRKQAQRRLESLECKLARQPEVKQAYCEFMNEYEELQHVFSERLRILKR